MSKFTITDGETIQEIAKRSKKDKVSFRIGPHTADVKTLIIVDECLYLHIPPEMQDESSKLDKASLKKRVVKQMSRSNHFYLNEAISNDHDDYI
jgi:hypothetical protein